MNFSSGTEEATVILYEEKDGAKGVLLVRLSNSSASTMGALLVLLGSMSAAILSRQHKDQISAKARVPALATANPARPKVHRLPPPSSTDVRDTMAIDDIAAWVESGSRLTLEEWNFQRR